MANTDILTRAGKTTALAGSEYDTNVDSMCGICEEVTGSTHTIAYTDQNKTIQYNNATSVAVTLPDAATIIASLDTTAFKIVLKNIGAGAVTVTSAVANELDGATTLVLNQYDSATIHSNSAGAAWNIITKDMDVVDINGGTIDGAVIGGTTPAAITGVDITLASGATVTGINDTDDMSDASATTVATSESIKAYVDGYSPPAGAVVAFAMETPPSNWLECNGAAISRTTYSVLFAAIGTSFGTGDGSTTFNIPDLRGQFIRGWDNTAGTDPDAAGRTASGTGGATGDNVGSAQSDDYKAHTHQLLTSTSTSGSTDALRDSGSGITGVNSGTSPTTGGNETRPTNVYLMYCIKT